MTIRPTTYADIDALLPMLVRLYRGCCAILLHYLMKLCVEQLITPIV